MELNIERNIIHFNALFKVIFLVRGCFLIFFYNTSLTHVASFQLMTPRPVGLRALGVETPLRA